MTDNAYFGIASLLFRVQAMETAHEKILQAIQICEVGGPRQSRNRILLGEIQAYDVSQYVEDEEKITLESISNLETAVELITEKKSSLAASALQRKAWFHSNKQKDYRKAAEVLQQMQDRSLDYYVNGRNIFTEELSIYMKQRQYEEAMNCFIRLKPVQRLSMMIDLLQEKGDSSMMAVLNWKKGVDYDNENLQQPDCPTDAILIAAEKTNRFADLRDPYIGIIEALNAGKRDLLWRLHLASYYYRATNEIGLALEVLKPAFQYTVSEPDIKFGSIVRDASSTIREYIDLTSDILYRNFKAARTPGQKFAILSEAEGLLQTPLSLSVVIPSIDTVPYLTIVATMAKRVGAFQKWQDNLQQAFDICWANLHDDVVENDNVTLRHLAKALAVGPPNLIEDASVIGAAQVYWLKDHSALKVLKNDDNWTTEELLDREDYDVYAKLFRQRYLDLPLPTHARCARFGFDECQAQFDEWGDVWYEWNFKPMYICLHCISTYLCKDCHAERLRRNAGEGKEGKLDFCCASGDYLRVPPAGWEGIIKGHVIIQVNPDDEDNEDHNIFKFDTFLDQVRDKWNKSWDDFWTGL